MAIINLGPGDNNRSGTNNDDTIRGDGGDDTLRGRRGDDRILGQAGDDDLFGNAGRDHLVGGFGNDELFGGSGRDRLDGGNGGDNLRGGSGRDRLDGGNGNDNLTGGGSGDRFVSNTEGGDDNIFDFTPSQADRISIEDLAPTQLNNLGASFLGIDRNVIDQGDFRAFLESPVTSATNFVSLNFDGSANQLEVFGTGFNALDPGVDIVGLG